MCTASTSRRKFSSITKQISKHKAQANSGCEQFYGGPETL